MAENLAFENPPDTNRGVEKIILSQNIDWIAVTFKNGKVKFPDKMAKEFVEGKPMHSYNVCSKFADGRLLLEHTERRDMPPHVIFTGDALKQNAMSPLEIVKWALQAGGTIKRIDLAVDVKNANLRPSEATERIKNGGCKTRAREFPFWASATDSGYTQYIGKKSSEIYARIYDKASESKVGGDWTRIEAIFTGDRAQGAAFALAQGNDITGLVRGFVDFPEWPLWGQVFSLQPVYAQAARVASKTRQWLMTQVAASIANQMILGDDEIWLDLKDAVTAYYETKQVF